MTKPYSEYMIKTRVYAPAVVAKALGIKLKKKDILSIYGDGNNGVRIEIYQSPNYRATKK